jgi:hypothetical protein
MNDVSLTEFEGPLGELVQQCKSNRSRFDEFKLWLKKVATGTFKYDKRKDGWTLLENSSRRISSSIDAVSFLKNENLVKGNVMAQRAVELDANYGQEDAEWLLEHQDMIPAELRNFYLVFPATKWRRLVGDRRVPYLRWDGRRWRLNFLWLGLAFRAYVRLVRPRK